MIIELPPSFPHSAPDGYSYEVEQYNNRYLRINLICHRKFDYNLGASTKTVHSFYSTKKQQYYAPVNYKTVGSVVSIENTRPWTAMQIKKTPLESAFN